MHLERVAEEMYCFAPRRKSFTVFFHSCVYSQSAARSYHTVFNAEWYLAGELEIIRWIEQAGLCQRRCLFPV